MNTRTAYALEILESRKLLSAGTTLEVAPPTVHISVPAQLQVAIRNFGFGEQRAQNFAHAQQPLAQSTGYDNETAGEADAAGSWVFKPTFVGYELINIGGVTHVFRVVQGVLGWQPSPEGGEGGTTQNPPPTNSGENTPPPVVSSPSPGGDSSGKQTPVEGTTPTPIKSHPVTSVASSGGISSAGGVAMINAVTLNSALARAASAGVKSMAADVAGLVASASSNASKIAASGARSPIASAVTHVFEGVGSAESVNLAANTAIEQEGSAVDAAEIKPSAAQVVRSMVSPERIFHIAPLGNAMTFLNDSITSFVQESTSIPTALSKMQSERAWLVTATVVAMDVVLLMYYYNRKQELERNKRWAISQMPARM